MYSEKLCERATVIPVFNHDPIFSCFASFTAKNLTSDNLSMHISREEHTTSYAMVLYNFSKFRITLHCDTTCLKGLRNITHSHLFSLQSYKVR